MWAYRPKTRRMRNRVLAGSAGDGRHELLERVEWIAVEQREDGPADCYKRVHPDQGL